MQLLFQFFHAVDEETGTANGVPLDVLKSPKYHDLQNLAFFYFEPTDALIRQSEFMASAASSRHSQQASQSSVASQGMNRLSLPTSPTHTQSNSAFSFSGLGGAHGMPSTRRANTIMLSRNLGTMRRAKEERRKEAQAEPSDDMILRILRMRPEAERYIRDRSRQKERLAAARAAEEIVKMSLLQGMQGGGGGIRGPLPRR